MHDKTDILQKFDNAKLFDVVKNHKQYGYGDSIRATAIDILRERGISEEDLKMSGNYSNFQFDNATELYKSFNYNSKVAFILYSGCLLIIILSATFKIYGIDTGMFFSIISIFCTVGYLFFLCRSFIDHNNFYTAIGKTLPKGDQAIFFMLGSLYIVMYFLYQSQMNEEMKVIK